MADSTALPPLVKPRDSLRAGLLRAGSWTVGGHFLSQCLRLAGNIILTRMLAPEAFGIMALASVMWVGIAMLSDMGLQQIIVRSPNGEQAIFANTVWSLQVLHGTAIALVLLC